MAIPRRECSSCHQNRAERFFVGPKGNICDRCRKKTRKKGSKHARLQKTYGITYREWAELLESQGGVCAICKGSRPGYDTDHDHAKERALREAGVDPLEATRRSVRALICARCNRKLLPGCAEKTEILEAAIEYLNKKLSPFD